MTLNRATPTGPLCMLASPRSSRTVLCVRNANVHQRACHVPSWTRPRHFMEGTYRWIDFSPRYRSAAVYKHYLCRHTSKQPFGNRIPDEVTSCKNREQYSSRVYWEKERGDLVITSYVVPTSKGQKNVLVLSTVEPLQGVTKDDGKTKPSIMKLYDFHKGWD